MTETEFLAEVLSLARICGLLAHHCKDSRWCEGTPGLLDVILLGRRHLLFAELKLKDGDTSAEQDLWIWHLDRARVMWEVWTPADLESGQVRSTMEALN